MVSKLIPNLRKRLFLVTSALIVHYLFDYVLYPNPGYWTNYFQHPSGELEKGLSIAVITCIVYCEVSLFIERVLNKRLPWIENPRKRLTVQALVHILISLVYNLLFVLVIDKCSDGTLSQTNQWELTIFLQWLFATTTISFFVSALSTGQFLIDNWKASILEASEHKLAAAEMQRVAAEAELQALKMQIDPHFVFNNLSVLSELILENQQLGYEYSENFARVYRYLLLNAKRDLIPLEDELRFLRAYLFLIENRIGDGVEFHIEVSPEALGKNVPPMVLQLLVENALKHNSTSKSDPLEVHITSTGDEEIVLSNTVRLLVAKPPSAQVGLTNVISRYALLTDRAPRIVSRNDIFVVTIPLI